MTREKRIELNKILTKTTKKSNNSIGFLLDIKKDSRSRVHNSDFKY